MLRYRDIPTHTTEVLDLTSLTVDECAARVPPCEAAFLDYRAVWPLHGQRRQSRGYTTYKTCPWPTPADRLFFMLVSLKQHTMPLRHGRVFGLRQSKATPWMHGLLPVLRNTLRTLGEAPCRSVEALRQHLGGEGPPVPLASAAPSEAVQAAPLFVMTAPNDPSRAPTIRRHRKRALAGRKSALCCTPSCCSTPRCASCS